MAVQSAVNHGIIGIMRSVVLDYVATGLRINCVCPGAMDSGFLAHSNVQSAAVLGAQLIKADEVANAVIFLLGPSSAGINAIALPVGQKLKLLHSSISWYL